VGGIPPRQGGAVIKLVKLVYYFIFKAMGRNLDAKCKQCRRIGEKLFSKNIQFNRMFFRLINVY